MSASDPPYPAAPGRDRFRPRGRRRGPADIIRMLLADAQPFIGSFSKGKVDLDAVESELKKVHLSTLYRDQICKDLHEPLGVRVDLLRAVGQGQELEARTNLGFCGG